MYVMLCMYCVMCVCYVCVYYVCIIGDICTNNTNNKTFCKTGQMRCIKETYDILQSKDFIQTFYLSTPTT